MLERKRKEIIREEVEENIRRAERAIEDAEGLIERLRSLELESHSRGEF